MPGKVTAPSLTSMKAKREKIVCITAYDAFFAGLFDSAGVDLILVGDSVANVMLGMPTTVHMDLAGMAHHVRAAATSVKRALLVADMPFGSYGGSVEQSVASAATLMKAGAEAVKLEGDYPDEVRAIVKTGAPVIGHLGLTPQSVNVFGGHKVQGRGEKASQVIEAALRLQEAGASAIVLETVPATLAAEVSKRLFIPTIGIGAGVDCDGEIQVMHDILGLTPERFKHSKLYVDGAKLFSEAVAVYGGEVRSRQFPSEAQSFEDR